jgi:predicted cupin superfamily sugar epimerase
MASWRRKRTPTGKRPPMNLETRPTAEEIKAMLGLESHPTCGFVAETYRSPLKIPPNALPEAYDDAADRPFGSALYFLVSPEAQIVMHRIRSDQLYHHYLGDPLEVLMPIVSGPGLCGFPSTSLVGN